MDSFLAYNNKILVDDLGRFLVPAELPVLEFDIESTEFPPTGHIDRGLRIRTRSLPQRIFIDYGDGSPIYEGDFVSAFFNPLGGGGQPETNADVHHVYADGSRKTVKIWFSHPEKISEIHIISPTKWNWIGEFPLNIMLYDLDVLYLRNIKFEEFPLQLTGGVFKELRIDNITETPINFIPKWIYYSRIATLRLLGGFNLSDLAVSNFEKLVNVQGLEFLSMSNIQADADNIPNNLKDISTLEIISLENIPITEIPTQINNCKQITELLISTFPNITSWGVGIANMPNLKTFRAIRCINITTDIVTGIETSGINRYETYGTYKTVERVNASILSVYNKVVTLASMTVGDTVLRNITWLNGNNLNTLLSNSAPTGTYQAPSGYVQGVSNGTPESALEMIYVLTKQYHWEIRVNTGVGLETITYTKNS